MPIYQTLLFFVGIPTAFVLLLAALTLPGGRPRAKRYRPGRPFDFTPVWFLSSPGQLADGGSNRRALAAGESSTAPSLTAGAREPATESGTVQTSGAATPRGTTGGASDRW